MITTSSNGEALISSSNSVIFSNQHPQLPRLSCFIFHLGNFSKTCGKHDLDASLRGHDELGSTSHCSHSRAGLPVADRLESRGQRQFQSLPGLFEQLLILTTAHHHLATSSGHHFQFKTQSGGFVDTPGSIMPTVAAIRREKKQSVLLHRKEGEIN
ncbi:hypothetical protein [Desulfonatronum thioautotrophicum]|uniref:hypothetical protein n=1 Tax=Desulfonatronum thioautotrophicum TaxID=617001 RepID=UPI001427ECAC|nr:hypothetical protein [Desulfonatronum thioautotrophicum]